MVFNWYTQEEMARERRADDLRAAEKSRLLKEALSPIREAGLKNKAMNALGAILVRAGSRLLRETNLRDLVGSLIEPQDENPSACATC